MKNILIVLVFLILGVNNVVQAEPIQAGVTLDYIPKALYGSWRVSAKLEETNAPAVFKPQSLDFWALSRSFDVIKLENPMSGASSEISVKSIEGTLVVFSKRLPYDGNKILTDTVTIRVNDNEFSGINTLSLEYYSLVDNHLMKTQTAVYHIKGEKIAGDSIMK